MRSKTFISMFVALFMALVLTTPAVADTARGKLVSDTIAQSAGSYVFKTDEYKNLTVTIKARKMVPNGSYRVGWVQYYNGGLDSYIYITTQANSRGSINFEVFNGHVYNEPGIWTFQAIIDSDYGVEAPWDLYGPVVELNFY